MTNFRKTALALASAFMMAGAAGAAGLPDILERDAAGTSAAQKAGAELARLVDGKDDAEAARRMEEREARLLAHYRDKLAASLSRLEASEAAMLAEAVKTASGAAAPDLMLVAESLLGEAVKEAK